MTPGQFVCGFFFAVLWRRPPKLFKFQLIDNHNILRLTKKNMIDVLHVQALGSVQDLMEDSQRFISVIYKAVNQFINFSPRYSFKCTSVVASLLKDGTYLKFLGPGLFRSGVSIQGGFPTPRHSLSFRHCTQFIIVKQIHFLYWLFASFRWKNYSCDCTDGLPGNLWNIYWWLWWGRIKKYQRESTRRVHSVI